MDFVVLQGKLCVQFGMVVVVVGVFELVQCIVQEFQFVYDQVIVQYEGQIVFEYQGQFGDLFVGVQVFVDFVVVQFLVLVFDYGVVFGWVFYFVFFVQVQVGWQCFVGDLVGQD